MKVQFCQKRDYVPWEGESFELGLLRVSFFFFFNGIVLLNFSGALHYDALHRASLRQFTLKD